MGGVIEISLWGSPDREMYRASHTCLTIHGNLKANFSLKKTERRETRDIASHNQNPPLSQASKIHQKPFFLFLDKFNFLKKNIDSTWFYFDWKASFEPDRSRNPKYRQKL